MRTKKGEDIASYRETEQEENMQQDGKSAIKHLFQMDNDWIYEIMYQHKGERGSQKEDA